MLPRHILSKEFAVVRVGSFIRSLAYLSVELLDHSVWNLCRLQLTTDLLV